MQQSAERENNNEGEASTRNKSVREAVSLFRPVYHSVRQSLTQQLCVCVVSVRAPFATTSSADGRLDVLAHARKIHPIKACCGKPVTVSPEVCNAACAVRARNQTKRSSRCDWAGNEAAQTLD